MRDDDEARALVYTVATSTYSTQAADGEIDGAVRPKCIEVAVKSAIMNATAIRQVEQIFSYADEVNAGSSGGLGGRFCKGSEGCNGSSGGSGGRQWRWR